MCMPNPDPTPHYQLTSHANDSISWLFNPLHKRTLCFDENSSFYSVASAPRTISFGPHAEYGIDVCALGLEIIIIAACFIGWRNLRRSKHKNNDESSASWKAFAEWIFLVAGGLFLTAVLLSTLHNAISIGLL